MKEKYEEFSKKKDGSRVLQALLKHSNDEFREKLFAKLIPQFLILMQDKYGSHVALKMVKYCPKQLRGKLIHAIKDKLNTLIFHAIASEVLEQIYV